VGSITVSASAVCLDFDPESDGVIFLYSGPARLWLPLPAMTTDNFKDQDASPDANADRERLLLSIHKVIGSALPTKPRDEMLDDVSQALLHAGIFRSIMIALVDHATDRIEVVTSVVAVEESGLRPAKLGDSRITVESKARNVGLSYPLNDPNITARVARSGTLTVVNEWNEHMDARVDSAEKWSGKRKGKIAYFIPLAFGEEVIGVVATGSLPEEKDAVMARIELIQPLLDLVAASLHHAQQALELDQDYRVRDSVAAVRLAIASMDKSSDWSNVISVIHTELNKLGLVGTRYRVFQYSIQIVNPAGTDFIAMSLGASAHDRERLSNWKDVSGNNDRYPWVLEVWKSQQVRYVTEVTVVGSDGGDDQHGLNLVDVPFSNGTLALNSFDPIPTSVINVLERFAEALTDGWEMFLNISKREQAEQELRDTNAQLLNVHEISRLTVSPLDREKILDTLVRLVVRRGVFRSLMVAQVDRQAHRVSVTRSFFRGQETPSTEVGISYDLDDPDIVADTVRTGETQIVVGWDERFTPHAHNQNLTRESRQGKVAYFVPIKFRDEVIAVIATGSSVADQRKTTDRLIELQPLWDQVAVALSNAALFEAAQKEIAERKQAERALAESEERFRTIYENAPVLMNAFDESGRCLLWNNECRKVFGWTIEEVNAHDDALALFYPDLAVLDEVKRSITTDPDGRFRAWYPKSRDGRTLTTMWANFRLPEGIVFSLGHDITERIRLEEQVISTERQSASTELAAGISHNLNNMLTGVLGPADLLLSKSVDPDVRMEAETIQRAGIRARDLVRRLNDAVRPYEGSTLQAVDLGREIQNSVELAQPRWKDEPEARGVAVEVVMELGEIPNVLSNAGELSEVILNLLLNATHAMPEGGTITISTRPADEAGFVTLTVSDTGIGMDEETCRRVFEPFFTTKVDIGSGLGLSTAYGTVTRSGGTIEAESELGQGTTFTIHLPTAEDETVAGAGAGADHPRRSGRILLVDDDQVIREVFQRMLSDKHTVEVVGDGADALKAFAPGHFDVALIDLGIPTVPGDRVAADMRERDPSLVTVLVTGWIIEEGDPRLTNFDLHLQKPIGVSDLDQIVSEAMAMHDSRV
jgi:PAS domain S-box-containing protein